MPTDSDPGSPKTSGLMEEVAEVEPVDPKPAPDLACQRGDSMNFSSMKPGSQSLSGSPEKEGSFRIPIGAPVSRSFY